MTTPNSNPEALSRDALCRIFLDPLNKEELTEMYLADAPSSTLDDIAMGVKADLEAGRL